MANEKMIKTAKTIDKIIRIVVSIALVCSIVMLVFLGVAALSNGSALIDDASYSVQLDFVKLFISQKYMSKMNIALPFAMLTILFSVFELVLFVYICKRLQKILAPMKEGRPFGPEAPANLKKIGWAIIVGGIVQQGGDWIMCNVMMSKLQFHQIFQSSVIEKITYEFNFDFAFLLIAGLLFLLSYIFSYGQQLQKESDETL